MFRCLRRLILALSVALAFSLALPAAQSGMSRSMLKFAGGSGDITTSRQS